MDEMTHDRQFVTFLKTVFYLTSRFEKKFKPKYI